MKKVIRKISIIVFAFIMLLMFSSEVQAGSQTLNSLNFDIEIKQDGSIHICETWNITATSTNTIFKSFDMGTNDNGDYKIKNVEVYDVTDGKEYKDSGEYSYHVDPGYFYGEMVSSDTFEIAWNIGADNSRKTKTYKISYDVENVIQNGKDFSQLYWQLISDENGIPISNATATITLPVAMEKGTECRVWGHGPLSSTIYQISETEIEVKGGRVSSGTMFEIRIAMPAGIFSNDNTLKRTTLQDVIDEETVWADESNEVRKSNSKKDTTIILDLINIGLVIFSVLTGYCIIKNIEKYKKSKNERYEGYQEYYRDIPDENATPGECLFLLDDNIFYEQTSSIIMANLLNFHTKGIIKIEEENNDVVITPNKAMLENSILKNEEKIVADLLKSVTRHSDRITMKELSEYIQDHATSWVYDFERIPNIVKRSETEKGYLDPKKHSSISAAILGIMMSLTFLVPMLVSILIAYSEIVTMLIIFIITLIINAIVKGMIRKIELYTVEGYKEKLKWKGLKKYLVEYSRIRDRETMDIMLWEKYLVYATAMGIASKVVDELKVVYPEMYEDMYTHSTMMHMVDTRSFSRDLNRTTSALRKSYNIAHPSSSYDSDSSFSSGSGDGGGFSGGGGGRRWRRKHGWKIKKSTRSKNEGKTRKKEIKMECYKIN